MPKDHYLLKSAHRDVYAELLSASQRDVKDEGGADSLAEVTGYHPSSITRCLRKKSSNDDMRQQSLSLFMLADLIAASDNPRELRVVHKLNDLAGLMAIAKADTCDLGHGTQAVAELSGEFAELVGYMSKALKDDNRVSAEEIIELDLIAVADRLLRVVATLINRWNRRLEGEDI